MHLFSFWSVCVVLCVPALNHGEDYISRGPNVGGCALECSIDEWEFLRPVGTMWNLFASDAMECRPVPWDAYLAPGFPGGIWTDGAAFRKTEHSMKSCHLENERECRQNWNIFHRKQPFERFPTRKRYKNPIMTPNRRISGAEIF